MVAATMTVAAASPAATTSPASNNVVVDDDNDDLDAVLNATLSRLDAAAAASSYSSSSAADPRPTEAPSSSTTPQQKKHKRPSKRNHARPIARSSPVTNGSEGATAASHMKRPPPRPVGILKSNPRYQGGVVQRGGGGAPRAPATAAMTMLDSPSTLVESSAAVVQSMSSPSIVPSTSSVVVSSPVEVEEEDRGHRQNLTSAAAERNKACVKDLVVERDPTTVAAASAFGSAAMGDEGAGQGGPDSSYTAVEGYDPRTTTGRTASAASSSRASAVARGSTNVSSRARPSSSAPVASSSSSSTTTRRTYKTISELVSDARSIDSTLRSDGIDDEDGGGEGVLELRGRGGGTGGGDDPQQQTIEADVSFSCLSPEQYEEALRRQEEEGDDDDDDDGDNDHGGMEETDLFDQAEAESDPTVSTRGHGGGGGGGGWLETTSSSDDGARESSSSANGLSFEDVFFGGNKCRMNVFGGDGGDGDDSNLDDSSEEENSLNDDEIWDLLGFNNEEYNDDDDDDDDEMNRPEPEKRPFLRIWEALSSWVTPDAVALVREWRSGEEGATSVASTDVAANAASVEDPNPLPPPYDTTDVGASRCAGLMSIIKMHLPKCLDEGGYCAGGAAESHRRTAERRLARLVRSFDYAQPTSRLDMTTWRAFVAVLLAMALPPAATAHLASGRNNEGGDTESTALPESVRRAAITSEEYRYLTRSALESFDVGL